MDDVEKLIDVIQMFHNEAKRCFYNECYIASLILYGSTLEALLLAMCFLYPERVRTTQVYRNKNKGVQGKVGRKKRIFLEFTLNDLIKIAEELKWLPMHDKVENIGIFKDWVKWVQETRNLVHPARWLRPGGYFGNLHELVQSASKREFKKFVEIAEETVSVIIDFLRVKVEEDLAKKLNSA